MKSRFLLLAIVISVLASCSSDNLVPDVVSESFSPIVFDLSAITSDMTRSKKTGWEKDDAIFVFFKGVEAPKYLKMSFDGTTWSSVEMDGDKHSPGALGLKNGDSGSMLAIYLPFGSEEVLTASGSGFQFSKTYYSYYMTATRNYSVKDNKVTGAFNMRIPADYVQFYVEDSSASDEACSLSTDAVIPVGISYIGVDGTLTETSDKHPGDDMPGYVFKGGYVFSGKVFEGGESDYYFVRTKDDNSRFDYFAYDKTLVSHSAIDLPSDGTDKWIRVGAGKTVSLIKDGVSIGTWHTCNYGSSRPEEIGTEIDFDTAVSLGAPTKEQLEAIANQCYWSWLTVKGQEGMVVYADKGFMFLPAQETKNGYYWSSTSRDETNAWHLVFSNVDTHWVSFCTRVDKLVLRLVLS